jgi:hypothetical protein
MNAPTETDEMNAPTEMEADQELAAEDDRDMPQALDLDPAGVITASVPESPDPVAPEYEGAAGAHGGWAEPGAADDSVADESVADVSDADVSVADVSDADVSVADVSDADVSDAGSPSAVVPAPDAEPEPALASPVAEDGTSADERWHEILTMFVDDPRSSVELAAGLVDDSAEALVMFVQERQHALLSTWQGDDAGTEQMRVALQGYRTFWNRIEDLSRDA